MLLRAQLFTSLIASLIVSTASATPAAEERSRADAQRELDAAQQRLDEAAREIAELSAKISGDPTVMMFLGRNPNRAMLGIGIAGDDDDKVADGVRVLSVSPGGPAAGAGIKAGDVIVDLNGKSLKRDQDEPSEKLLTELARLSPGDDVNLSYRRDGKTSAVKLKADRLPRTASMPIHFDRRIRDEHSDFGTMREFEMLRGFGEMQNGPFAAIELVPLSAKLGQYFGTEKGLLMVRVPQDKELKLEDGDVLIDIDGRVPSNPGHAFRILGSYQPGEKVTLNVMRQRKKAAISITVPEPAQRGARPPMPPRAPRAERPVSAPIAPLPPVSPVASGSATQPIT
jgi:S1-C subfamily serine protease